MHSLISIERVHSGSPKEVREPYYFIFTFEGKASFTIDFTDYECNGRNLLFLSPYQFLQWRMVPSPVDQIQFHGDFYCIEYHKKEVACNGILFNNIYQQPYVPVSKQLFGEIGNILGKMRQLDLRDQENAPVLRSYLQLVLALSSREKQQKGSTGVEDSRLDGIVNFQSVLEDHFIENREVAFFAEKFGVSVNAFSKKISKYFGKPPSKLIQERMVLEAKKLLHLTHKPVKEIADQLNFDDEFYFSRYFKKETGVSPKQFREKTGISVAAK